MQNLPHIKVRNISRLLYCFEFLFFNSAIADIVTNGSKKLLHSIHVISSIDYLSNSRIKKSTIFRAKPDYLLRICMKKEPNYLGSSLNSSAYSFLASGIERQA